MVNMQGIGKTLMSVFMPDQTQSLRAGEMQGGGDGIPALNTGSSFQDIFQLIDANTDLKLGTDELNIMSHLFTEGTVLAKDTDGDGALSAEEAGVPASLVADVDTNQDNKIDSRELGSLTDNMLGSIIQALDKDQDQALSMKELAALFFLFGSPNASPPVEPVEGQTEGAVEGVETAAVRQPLRKV
jgi:Ca2+-binding EF-hand superfamily protein